MEVSQVLGERSQWDTYMPVFANLLRPSMLADPVTEIGGDGGEELNADITEFRNSSDGQALKTWGDEIITLVFDGYADWAGYYASQPEWVLTNLAQVLEDASMQTALLERLRDVVNALSDTRNEQLVRFKNDIDRWVPQWQAYAAIELVGAQGPLLEGEERVEAHPNTDSWNYSRTPGTFYYKYLERDGRSVYVYSDDEDAADEDWHEASHWDELAGELAERPENAVNARFPEWDSSWASWSVLDNPKVADGRVYGKADEGRWYDYDGAVQAHARELQEQGQATPPERPAEVPDAASALANLTQSIGDDVLISLAQRVMQSLPPEVAGKAGSDVVVWQYVRDEISRQVVAFAAGRNSDSAR
jgi:hypothetical protein